MSERRVVVTGLGIINAAGIGSLQVHEAVTNGQCFLRPITRFNAENFPVQLGGEILNFRGEDHVPKRLMVKSDRFTHFAMGASAIALEHAGLDLGKEDRDRCGVWFGNDSGGWDLAERGFLELYQQGAKMVNPWGATAWFPTAPQGFTTIRYGITGQSKSFVADRASGAASLYFAWRAIRAGQVDVVLAGGTEAPFTALGMTCYYETGEVSAATDPARGYQPFDARRSGLVMGEGSAVLVLEEEGRARKRGARILGEIRGASMTCDPVPTSGRGIERAMRQALQRARVEQREVDLVFAEGAASRRDDALEAHALKSVFGPQGPLVTCPKSSYGHLYGASGAAEAVLGFETMRTGRVPPIVGLESPDEGMPAGLVRQAREARVSTFVVNARGREGVNVSLVMAKVAA